MAVIGSSPVWVRHPEVSREAFDGPVVLVARAFLPWTPLVPIAIGRRERWVIGLLVVAALVAQVFVTPFVAAAPLALAIACAARALDDVDRVAPVVVVTIAALGFLLARDLDRMTQSATWISVFLSCAALLVPRSWLPTSRGLIVIASGTMAGLAVLVRHIR